ncbi:Aminoacyl tRNA synthase complex-interacting multifunctional protein 1 [Collichthys lucidus]|uniref:Aminoacyl tRNA synthase complex-interacting multifunctional protein 1 n=1 Tax=Collichthys lucidus TaxID=240159 RepID=A0A4U5VWW9_COLLU|nr:Aminoacyl tRNA synthase complex-interacting multifunctional protein 1 [Collichthys lucidus]
MDNTDDVIRPSLAAALMKLHPEDGEQIVEYFKTHALLTREKALLQASVRDQKKLLVENGKLKKDIEQLKAQLQEKQKRRTAKALLATPPPILSPAPTTSVSQAPSPPSSQDQRERQTRRRRGERKARPTLDSPTLGAEPRVDVSRLDLRVGRILNIRRHPLAEGLTVQDVDVGEDAPRVVVSKLEENTDFEELQGSLAVLLCNVKAYKMKGLVSQARLLCCSASEDDGAELLAPPPGSTPGDRVTFLNYPGEPDRELQSKQKVWELVQPDLQVDSRGVANYKGCRFEVKGKGLCRAPSLTNCIIR